MKEDIRKELQNSESNKQREIAQRVSHLEHYTDQLNEYQITEFNKIKQDKE